MNALQAGPAAARVRVDAADPGLRIGARTARWGLVMLSIGFLAGLAMSLYAFHPIVQPGASLDQYDDLPRRLLRLAHIAAIMLPLITVVLGGWIDRLRLSTGTKEWASRLLLAGSLLLPPALAVEAVWALALCPVLSALPVIAFCVGVFIVSIGAARTRF